ncbi:hypothetical protein BKA64DRAFT_743483 [Cadophora sp. MPI-SDFR-AT-0126]|nr:hypothetical protein BKA64DRAFT_743483 [Leotiomycetes sp. MPI-SDFR-AT-0126]
MHSSLSSSSTSPLSSPITSTNPTIQESNHPSPTLLTLPPELLLQILYSLHPRTLTSIRLTCHLLERLAFPILFRNLPNWLDYKKSHAAIIALANDAYERPSGMWSPWASEPEHEVRGVWLGLLWRGEGKGGFVVGRKGVGGVGMGVRLEGEGVWVDVEGKREWLTAESYARLSRRAEMDERRLRVAQNRYLMHKDYSDGAGKKGVELKEGDGNGYGYGGEKGLKEAEVEVRWEEKEL